MRTLAVCTITTLLSSPHYHKPTHYTTTTTATLPNRRRKNTVRLGLHKQDDYEAVNPAVRLLGAWLPKSRKDANDPLDDIQWDAHKITNLSITQMRERVDDGLREREWFVSGRSMPELFADDFAFEDPDVKLTGIEQYSRQVRRLFDESSRAEVVAVEVASAESLRVTWRLSGRVNVGLGLELKPYVVVTTLDVNDDGLIDYQKDVFSLPGYDILASALLPFLRPLLAPAAPPVEVLRREHVWLSGSATGDRGAGAPL